MKTTHFPLTTLAATAQLADHLVQQAAPGSLLILSGPLGAGKTTLTQHIARALGSKARVSSPTYTLVHEYPTPKGLLVHVDAYRLPDVEALLDMGLEDYLARARLVVAEWGEGLEKYFPAALRLELSLTDGRRDARLHDKDSGHD